MIPIRDINPSRNFPVVTISLIGINVLLFLIQLAQGDYMDEFVYVYGLVPARFTVPAVAEYFSFWQKTLSLLSFMFLHGNIWHILGNMWSLYIFGDNVEDNLGPLRYLFFYLACGLISGLTHFFFNLHSNVPTIGASGALAGVMGAYFILFPHARILTLIPIIFIPWFVEIPAFFFLGIWFVLQVISAAGNSAGGIAWWAHIGGFLGGIALLKLLVKFPATGVTLPMRQMTERKTSSRLQVIQPTGRSFESEGEGDLFGAIVITRLEAEMGTRKTVNIPWGFYQRLFTVTVPPKTREGARLRLKGLGKIRADGSRGNMLLTVRIRH